MTTLRMLALFALMLAGTAHAARPAANALALPPGFAAMSLDDKLDNLVRAGYDRPDEALALLDGLRRSSAPRVWLQAAATIQAQAGRTAQANALAEQLLALAHDGSDPLAGAAANLVRAIVAESAGQLDVAAALAQSALEVYQANCPAGPADPARCDHRSRWRTLQLLQQRALGLGLLSAASAHAGSALGAAEAADDPYRQSLSLATLALLAAREGNQDKADQAITRAKRRAATVDDPLLTVRVRNIEAAIADLRGDHATTLRLTEESLAIAERANAERVSAQLRVNLTDLYAKQRRP
ncbi:MAG TPA: hypothetical protein VJ608_03670, partial [Albitalea sp.]|nr:hypothetical protein [Albitalea sp.]